MNEELFGEKKTAEMGVESSELVEIHWMKLSRVEDEEAGRRKMSGKRVSSSKSRIGDFEGVIA